MKKGQAIEEIYKKIKEMMYSNELAPGQKLIYQQLAQKLNVSITPVIQALNRLKDSNLVECIPNKGYLVREITEKEVIELYEVRAALTQPVVAEIDWILKETSENLHQRINLKQGGER